MLRRHALTCLLAAAGCSTAGTPADITAELAESPGDGVPRLWLAGDRIMAVAAPLQHRDLPRPVALMADAIAPGGSRTFVGREWGPRGTGYRIDCTFTDPPHVRSMLLTPAGEVLERSHTVPLAEVPERVLATALRIAPLVDSAAIVSGPEREEHWTIVMRDRSGRRFSARIALDGREIDHHRRFDAQLDG